MTRLFCAVLAMAVAGTAAAYGKPAPKAAESSHASPLASLAINNITTVDGSTLALQLVRGGLSREIVWG